jgi:hypothetical protein
MTGLRRHTTETSGGGSTLASVKLANHSVHPAIPPLEIFLCSGPKLEEEKVLPVEAKHMRTGVLDCIATKLSADSFARDAPEIG